ncbi:MAG: T9SS type A sorting domain-containing protein [candidate division Zixibacteria bacterium]|nr:T9SS type A sorting domain-containing protein [candidate division Zixibacteria bacterium]
MKRRHRVFHAASAVTIAVTLLLGASTGEAKGPDRQSWEAGSQTVDNRSYFDGNNLLMFVANTGSFAYDVTALFGKNDGLYYPKGGDKTCMFAGGISVGAMVPMRNGTFQSDRASFHVYKIKRGDTRTTNPDYRDWPFSDGAPAAKDPRGNDALDETGHKIPLLLGDQALWCVYNDADPSMHANREGGTAPLGVEIQTYCWGFDRLGSMGQTVFLRFTIINKGSNRLDSAYVGIWSDPDVGDAGDDLVGCDPFGFLGYGYNAGADLIYGVKPPAVGIGLLQGPIVVSTAGDSAWISGRGIWKRGYRDLGMTSFIRCINGTDPNNAAQSYNYMAGLDAAGDPIIHPISGRPTPYMFSGDPVAGTGWLDAYPSDRRFLIGSGAFRMNPGDTQEVVASVVVGQGAGYTGDTLHAEHTSGGSSTSAFAIIVDSSHTTGHRYRISFQNDGYNRYRWTLNDLTAGTTVAADQLNLTGDDGYPRVDGLLVKVIGNYPGVGDWNTTNPLRFTSEGANFGFEGFGGAIGWAGGWNSVISSSTSPRQLKRVLLMMAPTDAEGNFTPSDSNVSFAYRYGRRFADPPARPGFAPYIKNTAGQGYDYQDFTQSVPLSAWDVSSTPYRRLAVGFLENNVPNGLVNGRWWPPDYTQGSNVVLDGPREWLWIFDTAYSTIPDPSLQAEIVNSSLPVMYFLTVNRRDALGFADGNAFLIEPATDYATDQDVFEFVSPAPSGHAPGDPRRVASIDELKRLQSVAQANFAADFGRVRYNKDSIASAPAGTAYTVTVQTASDLDTLWLCYRPGGRRQFDSSRMTQFSGGYTGSIPAAVIGDRGAEFAFRGIAGEVSATLPEINPSAHPFIVRSELNNQPARTLPEGVYQMVGFPFDVSPSSPADVFADDLGAVDHATWRLGRWNSVIGAYDEYPDVGEIARGRGYWLIARGGRRLGASGLSALPDTIVSATRYGVLSLEPGWNQIATPFAFDIDWNSRIADAGIETAAWQYTGSGYDAVSTLTPYSGYWVRNNGAAAGRLLLPYSEVSSIAQTASSKLVATTDNWSLQLGLSSAGTRDQTNTVGVRPAAADGVDGYDLSEPPPFDRYVSLAMVCQDSAATVRTLAADYRAPGQTGWRYDLLVRGNTQAPATLEIGTVLTLPEDFEVALVENVSGRRWDLRQNPAVELPRKPTESGDQYTLFVGSRAFVETGTSGSAGLPISFALNQNYPNPFNSSTVFRYSTPSSGSVRLEIFDILGRKVRTLVEKSQPAGVYQVTWDGTNSHGETVASGIYFYRLSASGRSESKKMILLK